VAPITVWCIYGIINSAAVGTANINGNVIRSHTEQQLQEGISSTGAVTTALNINSNQLEMLVVA
jgi:hypothetical protein